VKKKTISIIHIVLVALTFISVLKGGFPRVYDRPEIIPYKLVPSVAEIDVLTIEIIEPNCIVDIPEIQREETIEIIYQRIKLQETGYWILNDVFWIDDKPYILIKIKESF
jgi:hypothetical protein